MFTSVFEGLPSRLDVETDEAGNCSVLIPLAVSDDERRRVAVITTLLPFDQDGVVIHELQFFIIVEDVDTGEVFETHDRDMATGYLPAETRSRVMECVCAASNALIGAVQPQAIYRVTKAIRPPQKALHKHQLITDTLLRLGYVVTQEGTDAIGRRFWLLER